MTRRQGHWAPRTVYFEMIMVEHSGLDLDTNPSTWGNNINDNE